MLWSNLEEITWSPVELEVPSRAWERFEVLQFQDHSAVSPKCSHHMYFHIPLKAFATVCKISKMSSSTEIILSTPRFNLFPQMQNLIYVWGGRGFISEVYICSQLVLGRHLGVLKPFPSSSHAFSSTELETLQICQTKRKCIFKWRWRKKNAKIK